MTATITRTRATKAQVAAFLAANGIVLAEPLRQKDGYIKVKPQLPPRPRGLNLVYKAVIGSRGLDMSGTENGWVHEGTRYVPGEGFVALTDAECEAADTLVARLREIDELLRAAFSNASLL